MEYSLWDDRLWSLALKADKPVDVYHEGARGMEQGSESSTDFIDALPNKDWLRA